MAATQLPDGSVVMQPPGQRPYPVGGGTGVTRPAQAKTAGKGASSLITVNGSTTQRGRAPVSTNAFR